MTDIAAYYGQLIGASIADFRLEPDAYGQADWPIFTLRMPEGDGIEICLSRDPEGNGGGFAFIGPANG